MIRRSRDLSEKFLYLFRAPRRGLFLLFFYWSHDFRLIKATRGQDKTWCSSRARGRARRPSHRYPFEVSSSSQHRRLSVSMMRETSENGLPSGRFALWRSPSLTHNCFSCDERRWNNFSDQIELVPLFYSNIFWCMKMLQTYNTNNII